MSAKKCSFWNQSLSVVIFCGALISSTGLRGQDASTQPAGIPDEWTHHHVVFSDPGTLSQAVVRGKLEEWQNITSAPRFKMQQAKRALAQRGAPPPPIDFATRLALLNGPITVSERSKASELAVKKDWSMVIGGLESITGTFTGTPATNTTLTITGSGNTLILTATAATSSASCTYSGGTDTVHFDNNPSYLANLITLINTSGCGSVVGVTASNPSGAGLQIAATTAGTATISVHTSAASFGIAAWDTTTNLAGGQTPTYTPLIYPAKYDFYTGAANCDSAGTPDFVVYPTGLTGSATQPNVVAYDNLYSGCSTSVVPSPNIYWQFNTGGLVTTSPVLSLDGKQVAFVQLSAGVAQLVFLKWNKNSALQSPAASSASAYNTCSTTPCWFAITFAQTAKYKGGTGGTNTLSTPTDTYSSPFYDYASDSIYVGEDNGYVHKFSPVFNGAPAEVTTNWPVQTAVAPINSPVYDSTSGLVFAGPAVYASNSGAKYHSIPSAGGTASASGSLGSTGTNNYSIFGDGAIVDSSAETVYVFVNDDGAGNAAVWQLTAMTFPPTNAKEAIIGQGAFAAGDPIYIGSFDNIYFTHSSVGNLYVCGRDGSSQEPALWKVNINGTTLTPTAIDTLTTAATQCSPVTEFDNNGTDYIFLSVNASAVTVSPINCPGGAGCIMSFTVTGAIGAGQTTTATGTETGGTTGIIIDNAVPSGTLAGASQVYFNPLGNQACGGNSNATAGVGTGPCAIQASQSAP